MDSAFVRYTMDDSSFFNPLVGNSITSTGSAFPQFSTVGADRNQFLTVSETHTFSPVLLNQARLSFSRTNSRLDNNNLTTPLNPQGALIGPQYQMQVGQPIGSISIGGLTGFGPNGTSPQYHIMNVYSLSDDVFLAHGLHAFKFGTLLNRYQTSNLYTIPPSITFTTLQTFLQGVPQTYSALTPWPGQATSNTIRNFKWNTLGFYAQDDFRATPRLTLNLGLRYEIMTQPREQDGIESTIPDLATSSTWVYGPMMNNFTLADWSPRFGFAWDVTGKGKTSLRGGVGLYYDVGNIGSPLTQNDIGTPPYSASNQATTNGAVITIPFTFPVGPVGSIRIVQYSIKQPYTLQQSLTFEQQLPFGIGLSVGYAGTRGVHVWVSEEGNPRVPTSITNGVPFWGTANNPRANPAWGSATYEASASSSWYHGMSVTASKRLNHGLEFQGSYVWSHST